MSRVAILVPGIMGSSLSIGDTGEELWSADMSLNYRRLRASPGSLAWSGTAAKAELIEAIQLPFGAVGRFIPPIRLWRSVIRKIEDRAEFADPDSLLKFGYDWRASLLESATEFAEFIRWACEQRAAATQERPDDIELVIIAHSMGGLVARIAVGLDLIDPLRISLLAHIGSPLRGSPKAFGVAYGADFGPLPFLDEFVQLFRFKNRASFFEDVKESMKTFPSLYQLLPHASIDYVAKRLPYRFNPIHPDTASPVAPDMLKQATDAHSLLGESSRKLAAARTLVMTVYTGMHTSETVIDFVVTELDGPNGHTYQIERFSSDPAGDGTVPAYSAHGEEWCYMRRTTNVGHLQMCNDETVASIVSGAL